MSVPTRRPKFFNFPQGLRIGKYLLQLSSPIGPTAKYSLINDQGELLGELVMYDEEAKFFQKKLVFVNVQEDSFYNFVITNMNSTTLSLNGKPLVSYDKKTQLSFLRKEWLLRHQTPPTRPF